MEDKKMTEKESLELITQMIQNSKKNLRLGNVNILLLWGYLCTITALVVYVLILILVIRFGIGYGWLYRLLVFR